VTDTKCGTYGGQQKCLQGLVRKPEGKRPLGRPRHRWENKIKIHLTEFRVGRGGLNLTVFLCYSYRAYSYN
jgi:hypothetical protein